MTLRLPVGRVTVLLGRGLARRRVMLALDERTGRTEDQHAALVRRLTADEDDSLEDRRRVLDELDAATPIVLADRFTDGLGPADRRAILARLRMVADGGTAVLVDDVDPVAALAVADDTLRIDPERGPVLAPVDPVGGVDYLAS